MRQFMVHDHLITSSRKSQSKASNPGLELEPETVSFRQCGITLRGLRQAETNLQQWRGEVRKTEEYRGYIASERLHWGYIGIRKKWKLRSWVM